MAYIPVRLDDDEFPVRLDDDGTLWITVDCDKVKRVIVEDFPWCKTFYEEVEDGEEIR